MNQSLSQPARASNNQRILMIGAIAAGVILVALAVLYFITPAAALPHFFPGYNATLPHYIHYKHGIAALLLGLAAFALAWFSGGTRSTQPKN